MRSTPILFASFFLAISCSAGAQVMFGQVTGINGPTKEVACSAAQKRGEQAAKQTIALWESANRKGLTYEVGECSCQENLSGAANAPSALKYFCDVTWRLLKPR